MDEALLDAYRATRYLVCLDGVEWAELRIGCGLPRALQIVVGERCWGFITAWNPRSLLREESLNLGAQRSLSVALMALPDAQLLPGIGIGEDGWSEPSLFVTGPSTVALDALANAHQQNAYVHGRGDSPAQLRLLLH